MGCAVTILSHDEAMALPPAERPLNYRLPSDIYHAVFEAVGHASLCWEPKPEGVFDTSEAEKAAVNLCLLIAASFEKHGVILAEFRSNTPDQTTGKAERVPRPVHTKPLAAEGQEPPLSGPVSHEKTQCTAAASIEGSSSSQTNHTSHTPSIFAAPTQFLETADARGPVVTPDKNGI